MSQNQSDQAPGREVAHRLFAAEFNDATHTFQESDEERAPVYALLPTGEKANRVFIVGTVTETNNVGDDEEYWQGRIVDPTETVFAYAGQYQPEAAAFLREVEPPAFVAIVGKPRSYETDDGTVNVSLRPEHISEVDEQTRHRWVSETASRTLDRIEEFDADGNTYGRMAREQYDGDIEQYRQKVITALETLDEVSTDEVNAAEKDTDEKETEATDSSAGPSTATSEGVGESSTPVETTAQATSSQEGDSSLQSGADADSETMDVSDDTVVGQDDSGETTKDSTDDLDEFNPET
jgi:RPA family protein